MKKLAVDSYYYNDSDCYTVGVIFNSWTDKKPEKIVSCHTSKFGPYIPGQFWIRELPGIKSLLGKLDMTEFDTIVVDGFVNFGKDHPGLGEHLHELLGDSIQVVGIAKSKFTGCEKFSKPVFRGKATNPLWVQGIDPDVIKNMSGNYKIPDLLKILDKETKKYR